MGKEICNLEPKALWENFYNMCQIPHPSKHEEKIRTFLVEFGKGLGLETITDEVGNVIIRKPATPGMENRKGIVLQGHMDMVPQKNNDKNHDFEKDPIETIIGDDGWIKANGTTLGADNGIGCAAGMAVLQSKDIAHGPIEVLITTDEETGMTGAFGLQPGILKGDILLNLDSEDEGELYVGCAGGVDGTFVFDYKKESVPANYEAYKINIGGLKGGHSGMDIVLGLGNANKLIIRFLYQAIQKFSLRLASIEGGSLRNAIPREASVVVVAPKGTSEELKQFMFGFFDITSAELSISEPDYKMTIEPAAMPEFVIDADNTNRAVKAIYACPNGVIRMSDAMVGLVETSTNLAIVSSKNDKITINCLLRSSVNSAKEDLSDMMASVFALAGAKFEFEGGYPGWKPNPNSPILEIAKKVYLDKYGKTPDVKAIHAGLECGLLGDVYPKWDMLSFGPTIRNPHSPRERVNIETVNTFWNYLVEILKNAPVK
jgi:dipeptidase D